MRLVFIKGMKELKDYTIDELYGELNRREPDIQKIEKERIYKLIASKDINGKTTKDFVVYYYPNEGGGWNYAFYLVHNGIEYCSYYGFHDVGGNVAGNSPPFWWPQYKDDDEFFDSENAICEFIPNEFVECQENLYEFNGTLEEATEVLAKCGFNAPILDSTIK